MALSSAKRAGFTLIELISVILILGILAVSVTTILPDKSGFAEATYEARLISALRNMQMRAMQDSRDDFCFQINFDANGSSLPAFGAPTLNYEVGNESSTCDTDIDYDLADAGLLPYTNQDELADNNINLTVQDFSQAPSNTISTIGFDGFGRPVSANRSDVLCDVFSCVITITGESTRYVCIGPQGYIFRGSNLACTPIT